MLILVAESVEERVFAREGNTLQTERVLIF